MGNIKTKWDPTKKLFLSSKIDFFLDTFNKQSPKITQQVKSPIVQPKPNKMLGLPQIEYGRVKYYPIARSPIFTKSTSLFAGESVSTILESRMR